MVNADYLFVYHKNSLTLTLYLPEMDLSAVSVCGATERLKVLRRFCLIV